MPQKKAGKRRRAEENSRLTRLLTIRRLLVDRHFRDTQQTFAIEGVRNVIAAAANGFEFRTVIRSRKLLQVSAARQLVDDLAANGTSVVDVSPEEFRTISTSRHASGVAGVVMQQRTRIDDITGSAELPDSEKDAKHVGKKFHQGFVRKLV